MEINVMIMRALDSRAELDISTIMGIKQIRQVRIVITFSRYGTIVLRPQQMNANSLGLNDKAAENAANDRNVFDILNIKAVNDCFIAPQQFLLFA